MNIVFVGHVDHGKSTVIGRMLADTNSLPEGKLERIKETCERHSRPFEYAFLLDALKDEQSQGITIDMARCFFQTKKRRYLILDAPGHVEFLKNMVTGAAQADAAILVIDASEGIRENSRRHGYLLSMLGIRQIVVCVNKMDLVDHDQRVFDNIEKEYRLFLKQIELEPLNFVPVSATKGDNIVFKSEQTPWYTGRTILEEIDNLIKEPPLVNKPFRLFLQDVYKFTKFGDNRRIYVGRIESGTLEQGDRLIFLPSKKRSQVETIEYFNPTEPVLKQYPDASIGFTLTEQIYVQRGELVCKIDEQLALVGTRFRVNLFWMGHRPMELGKRYFLKIGTTKTQARLIKINMVVDGAVIDKNLNKNRIDRHDAADCILETQTPIPYDPSQNLPNSGRFVIVDQYEISGGGIIRETIEDEQAGLRQQTLKREMKFARSGIHFHQRAELYHQLPTLILITGSENAPRKEAAMLLEESLFYSGKKVYFLGVGNVKYSVLDDTSPMSNRGSEFLRRLGGVAYLMLDAGLIVIATARDLTDSDVRSLETLISPHTLLAVGLDNRDLGVDNSFCVNEKTDFPSIVNYIEEWLRENHRVFYVP
ncbi:MAG: hypothetical protein B6244_02625 [Candidatus Cloacimonetes bacterium 4572_55]|nr:MAG: hypothetical protein B6244_02625 [Candidatus Cloacimonetes bacterium 4572_55]